MIKGCTDEMIFHVDGTESQQQSPQVETESPVCNFTFHVTL